MRNWICLAIIVLLVPICATAGDRDFRLNAPKVLIESGLLKHLLPRFSLKTQIRITLVEGDAEVSFSAGDAGKPVFVGADATWHMRVDTEHPGAVRFADWLASDVGQKTLTSYQVDGVQAFTLPVAKASAEVAVQFDGDAELGLKLSSVHCGRCHVVSEANRMNAIGSSPSFHVLRTMGDWESRFQAFYVLNPHPSFTQIEDVTEPFPVDRPPTIVPVEMTLEDLDAILAYVNQLQPADLGAPILHQ